MAQTEGTGALRKFCELRLKLADSQRYIACSAVIRAYSRAVNRELYEMAIQELMLKNNDKFSRITSTMIGKEYDRMLKNPPPTDQSGHKRGLQSQTSTESEVSSSNGNRDADTYSDNRTWGETTKQPLGDEQPASTIKKQ